MKKQISTFTFLLISLFSIAQNETMVGKWRETKFTFTDTTDAGRDLMNENYEAYRTGEQILDPKFITSQEGFNEDMTLTITKEKEIYWAIDQAGLKHEIYFDSKFRKYFVKLKKTPLEVKYDVKSKHLYLINPEVKNTFYELKRTN